jgi:hypothetical protein
MIKRQWAYAISLFSIAIYWFVATIAANSQGACYINESVGGALMLSIVPCGVASLSAVLYIARHQKGLVGSQSRSTLGILAFGAALGGLYVVPFFYPSALCWR